MIESRLENWARHWKTAFHKRATTSLEGNYRPPRGAEIDWETDPVAMAPKPAPDAADAVLVENAWVVMFDPRLKELLRRHYCTKRSPASTIKALRFKRSERYGAMLYAAHNAIQRELNVSQKLVALRRISVVNQITLSAYQSPCGRVAHV
jgi:hypothetical protein